MTAAGKPLSVCSQSFLVIATDPWSLPKAL
jgi:hypothetical protein